ncbi:MAG: ABC transporter ATP-binding protein [Flexilinea sp.]
MENMILELKEITKIFPHPETPVIANDKVSLSLCEGEILAIVGENGTGKSTLMNILYGLLKPDSGQIYLYGKQVNFKSPSDAIANGIGMVHQHFILVPSFTVAENLVFGCEPSKNGILVDSAKAIKITEEVSKKYGFHVDPERKIQDCPLSMQQRVEILRILLRGAQILIFDEPTAVLTLEETDELFRAFKELRKDGKSIIFITHKLREVMEIADRVTVMRKGKVISTTNRVNTSVEDLAEKMVGRQINISERIMENEIEINERSALLQFQNINTKESVSGKKLSNLSFTVHKGEIIGIAGVGGNGQELLVETISGLTNQVNSGRVLYKDVDITGFNASEMRDIGIAHITGDRYLRGISSVSNIHDNMIMGAHRRKPWTKWIFIRPNKLRQLVDELIKNYNILTTSQDNEIMNLSGGNIQKCILARELNLASELILAEEPTRGIDVGSQLFIHQMLIQKSMEGFGIVLVSTDLDEIMSLSNVIYVMFEGRIIGKVDPEQSNARKQIGMLMAGINMEDEKESA